MQEEIQEDNRAVRTNKREGRVLSSMSYLIPQIIMIVCRFRLTSNYSRANVSVYSMFKTSDDFVLSIGLKVVHPCQSSLR
jgi:hypothetical protein